MRKIFVPAEQIVGDVIFVRGEDVTHMRDVLRMKPGNSVVASCGRGTNYLCEITSVGDDEIKLSVKNEEPDIAELPVKISLYQSLPKSDKLELVIQKAVELGAAEVIPVRSARSVVKLDAAKAEKKHIRWQKIAEGASKQAGRGEICEVLPVMDFDGAVKKASESECILIPYELSEDYEGLKSIQRSIESGAKSIAVFIGPEGGFERSEVEAVVDAGGRAISLGHRILRTETAAIAVLAHIMFVVEMYNKTK
ncbi:MAG: 16S rRNA (uracil(1498)-N(3))-methyltransferase [Eubacterium sp.]|nr:16S rRNA (uracil(1498)-N(3))-methyltransferase [Eubacterium sp.]